MVFSSMIKALLLCIAALTLLATPSSSRPRPPFTNHILSGQQLGPGDALVEGGYQLIMQNDCNLVLYDLKELIWSTGTRYEGSGCYLSLEKHGNLVIYDNTNRTVWKTNTNIGFSYYILLVQKDRNVMLYSHPFWSTLTHKYTPNLNGIIIIPGAHNGTVGTTSAEKNKMRKLGKDVKVMGDK